MSSKGWYMLEREREKTSRGALWRQCGQEQIGLTLFQLVMPVCPSRPHPSPAHELLFIRFFLLHRGLHLCRGLYPVSSSVLASIHDHSCTQLDSCPELSSCPKTMGSLFLSVHLSTDKVSGFHFARLRGRRPYSSRSMFRLSPHRGVRNAETRLCAHVPRRVLTRLVDRVALTPSTRPPPRSSVSFAPHLSLVSVHRCHNIQRSLSPSRVYRFSLRKTCQAWTTIARYVSSRSGVFLRKRLPEKKALVEREKKVEGEG